MGKSSDVIGTGHNIKNDLFCRKLLELFLHAKILVFTIEFASVVELADTLDLGSSTFGCGGSTPFARNSAGITQW